MDVGDQTENKFLQIIDWILNVQVFNVCSGMNEELEKVRRSLFS